MENLKTISLALLVASSSATFAQEPEKELAKTIFKLSPQHFTANTLKMGLEIFTTPAKSISFYLGGRTGNNDQDYSSSNQFDGFLGELQY